MITSAETSIKQVARGVKVAVKLGYKSIFDFGGGKYDLSSAYAKLNGSNLFCFDPYNRSEEHNIKGVCRNYDIITCNNVLNVVEDVEGVVKELSLWMVAHQCEALVTIYAGDRSGVGKKTSKGWQNNQKMSYYESIFKKAGLIVRKECGAIILNYKKYEN